MGDFWNDLGRGARDLVNTVDPIQFVERVVNPSEQPKYVSPVSWMFNQWFPGNSPGAEGSEQLDPASAEAARNAANQKKLMDESIGRARDFRNSLPGYENDLYNQITGETKAAIAQRQADIRRQSNRRGLLFSGLRAGAERLASADLASEGANKKAKVAPELERMASDLENQANQMTLDKYAYDIDKANQVYDQALNAAKQRASQLGSIFGAVGAGVGQYYGKGEK